MHFIVKVFARRYKSNVLNCFSGETIKSDKKSINDCNVNIVSHTSHSFIILAGYVDSNYKQRN